MHNLQFPWEALYGFYALHIRFMPYGGFLVANQVIVMQPYYNYSMGVKLAFSTAVKYMCFWLGGY